MPYNFNIYTYNKLPLNEYKKFLQMFPSVYNNPSFINNWSRQLFNSDKEDLTEFELRELEHYLFTLPFCNIQCALSITKVYLYIKKQNITPISIELTQFKKLPIKKKFLNTNTIFYRQHMYSMGKTNHPIIILKTFNEQFWVIDGNHRVSNKKLLLKKNINAYIVEEKNIMHCFSNSFSLTLRKCYQEICHISDEVSKNKI